MFGDHTSQEPKYKHFLRECRVWHRVKSVLGVGFLWLLPNTMRNVFSCSNFVSHWKVNEQAWTTETWKVLLGGNVRDRLEPFEKMIIFQLRGGSMAKYPLSIAEGSESNLLLLSNPEWERMWSVSDNAIVAALDGTRTITCTILFLTITNL